MPPTYPTGITPHPNHPPQTAKGLNFYHSGDETGQSPYDQHGRGQREVVFASERFQSLGQEGEERQEYGVGGGVPPQAHAQRHDAFHHEFHTEIGSVEHEVERYEDKAPEQELAFHDPHAFQVRFDGLLPVEEEPCGDGEEDVDTDCTTTLHDELEARVLNRSATPCLGLEVFSF